MCNNHSKVFSSMATARGSLAMYSLNSLQTLTRQMTLSPRAGVKSPETGARVMPKGLC